MEMKWGEPSLKVKFAWIASSQVPGLDSEVPQDILPSGKQQAFNCPLVAIVPAGYHCQVVLPHQPRATCERASMGSRHGCTM